MTRRNWKRLQPTTLRQALEWCKDHARERRNYSVERIAAHMGVEDHWTIYKWINSGRIPLVMVRPFEDACGIDFATRWLAASAGKLLLDVPTGRLGDAEDINELQALLTETVRRLISFYTLRDDPEQTLAAIRAAMEGLAAHHGNVEHYAQPDLDLQLQ